MIFLKQFFYAFVVPHPFIVSFFHSCASLGHSPDGLWDRCRIVKVHFGKALLDGIGSLFCVVMGDRRIKVVGHVGGADFVMQKVNDSPWVELVVGSINGVKSTLDKVVVVLGKVWDVNVGVLQPLTRRNEQEKLERAKNDKETHPQPTLTMCREPTRR